MITKENYTEEKTLQELLEKVIKIYEENRTLAIDNYKTIKKQYDNIISMVEMSESGAVEKAMNEALNLVFKSGAQLENVINVVSKMLMTNMINDSKERVAKTFSQRTLDKPVDIQNLLEDKHEFDKE